MVGDARGGEGDDGVLDLRRVLDVTGILELVDAVERAEQRGGLGGELTAYPLGLADVEAGRFEALEAAAGGRAGHVVWGVLKRAGQRPARFFVAASAVA